MKKLLILAILVALGVVAVVRGDRLIVPRGDTSLRSGDEVIVLVAAEAEDAVHAVFISATGP